MPVAEQVAAAVEQGRLSGRVWLYTNYHCNLACTYCLTESAPRVDPRVLHPDRVRRVASEAAALGFTGLGITGGEPFLVPGMPELLADLARILPVTVLSNATLFTPRLVGRLRPLAALPVSLQVSLDRADPVANDAMRGPQAFRKVTEALPQLVDAGVRVRIASTLPFDEVGADDAPERQRLCALHRAMGISDADHVIRPIVRRGRALVGGMGVAATREDLEPELTVTADGAFWSPFAPTVANGRLDTDLLVTRTVTPLAVAASTMVRLVEGRAPGHDTTLGIR